jgi:hypothetical protein
MSDVEHAGWAVGTAAIVLGPAALRWRAGTLVPNASQTSER